MIKYILKRLGLSVLILLGVSVILYTLMRCMPTSYVEQSFLGGGTGRNMADHYETYYQMLADCGLAESNADGTPVYETDENGEKVYYWYDDTTYIPKVKEMPILKGYFNWLTNALQGNFGTSFVQERAVSEVIFENMGVSFVVAFIALILEMIIAIPLGIQSACKQYSKLDYGVTVLTMIGISFPSFFFGRIVLILFGETLGWFPVSGLIDTNVSFANVWEKLLNMGWHLVLPVAVLTILSVGSMVRYVRTNTLEVLSADYIRTARAKGLSERTVIYKHAFRNTMIPVVTTLAGTLPGLFGGAMITEQVFSLPGIGNTAYQLLSAGDIPFVMGYNMFIAALTVLGVLLADLMYAVVDPRVKLA